jgi:hypothetical protein
MGSDPRLYNKILFVARGIRELEFGEWESEWEWVRRSKTEYKNENGACPSDLWSGYISDSPVIDCDYERL